MRTFEIEKNYANSINAQLGTEILANIIALRDYLFEKELKESNPSRIQDLKEAYNKKYKEEYERLWNLIESDNRIKEE